MHNFKLLAGGILTALFLFTALCSAQTISIVSGDGQLVCPDCPGAPGNFAPLVVQVKDANGAPVVGTTVTWTVNNLPQGGTSTTDANGQASFTLLGPGFFFGSNFLLSQVVAAALNTSVTFMETTTQPVNGQAPVAVALNPYGGAPTISGAAGATGTTPIQVNVYTSVGIRQPLSGVSVSLTYVASTGKPTVTCSSAGSPQAGIVLTDASGNATCTPLFGGTVGTGNYTIQIGGGIFKFGPGTFSVTPGVPGALKYISGNNQSVNPGATTALPLTAQVTDVGGNLIKGATVTWTITSGSGTLVSPVTTSDNNGYVTTKVTATAGPVGVTVALTNNPAVTYVFTVKVIVPPASSLTAVSPPSETTPVNTDFPDPLVVQANDSSGHPVAGVTVNFSVDSNIATLSASSASTNAQGQAQVTATAGATVGSAVVTASITVSNKTYSTTFNLNVTTSGALISAIANAAGFQDQFVSPCSLATIFGTGLATGIQGVVASFIQPQDVVANVSVKIGGFSAPILDVANENGQESVSVQMPCELASLTLPTSVNMVVTVNGHDSDPFPVTVSTYSPGIFQSFDSVDGVLRAVLVRPDGSFVSVGNPARRGEVIRMWVTGLGPTTPALFTNEFDPLVPGTSGDLVPQVITPQAGIVVGVNNSGVDVISASYAYGMVGVFEVDFKVPDDTATGNNAPFAIAIALGDTLLFGNGSLIPIL